MLRSRKYWRTLCALWKSNFPACFALSCSSTRTGNTRGTAPPSVFPILTLRPSTAFVSDRRRDHAHINRVTTMGELTASMAHEIKQPICAAITDAKTCLRWLGRDEPDIAEASEAASRIVKDVMHAADIIGSITSLFKKGALHRE